MNQETYIRAILECNFAGFKEEIIETAVKKIMEYDATVEPIKLGKWARHTVHRADGSWYYSGVECSVCGNQENGRMRKYNYCPNCGARMREVTE